MPSSMGLKRVCFVGVPCQITPVRKIQLADPAFLDNGRKKEKHIERQTKFLKGFGEIVRLHHRPAVHRGVHLRGPDGAEDPGGDGHPAHRREEVQREGEGADLQEGRRGGGDEPPQGAGVRPAGVPPLRRLHGRAGRHLLRRRRVHGLDDHRAAHRSAARSSSTTWCAADSSRRARWRSSRTR